jgi:heat shock protein HtpX
MFKRIMLFMLVNVLVLVTISIVTSLLGVGHYLTPYGINYESLLVFTLIWGMGGAFISLGLSRILAKWMLGVRVIDPSTHDPQERWLLDTVYRLARQAGLPAMPQVGFYESPEVNAFATGPSKRRSLVAVSSGLYTRMDRGAVEGVLAHEVSHVANGDMVTMTLIQGVVNAIVMFIARVIAFTVSQGVRAEMRGMVNFITVLVLEIALSVLGMMVVAYFSRIREFRADRGGAKLAGREKMIGALEGLKRTLELATVEHAPSVATLKISGRRRMSLFSTHPSLDDRIAALQRG